MDERRRALAYLVSSAFAFAVMSLFVRLAGARLPSQEVVFVRAVLTLVFTLALLRHAKVRVWGENRKLLLWRGIFGFAALSCFYFALTRLPLAEATVIQYTNPIFTALLATIFLRERAGIGLVISIVLGFAGVVVTARPALLLTGDGDADPLALLAALGGAVFSAFAYVVVRRLSRSEHPLVIVFYFPLVAMPGSLPWIVDGVVWPTAYEWLLLLMVAIAAQLAQIHLTRGLAEIPAAPAMTVLYLQVLFATLLGILVLGERPDPWTLVGSLLILAGTVLAAATSRRRKRGAFTPQAREAFPTDTIKS